MKRFAIALWIVQALASIVMFVASVVEIETIIVTGPLLSIVGVMLAVVTHRLCSWATLCYAISAPAICVFCAVLIGIFDWGPAEARGPIPFVLGVYILIVLPAAIVAGIRIRQWRIDASQLPVWRFGMKTLLGAMTAVCLVIVAARLVSEMFGGHEGWMFGGFALATTVVCAVVLWRFIVRKVRIN